MMWVYFWILIAGLAVMLAVTLAKPERIYEYPFFMAATFIVFIVPQAISFIRFPGGFGEEQVANVLLMTCLCFAMCWAGYQLRPAQFLKKTLAWPINLDRLFHGGLVFIAVSYFFNYLITGMTEEETGGSMWTGKVTIYAFFAGLIYPAFAICLFTALRTNGLLAWLSVIVAAIQPLQASVLAGRRETTVLFLLTISLTLYYYRGIKPPRLVVLFSILFAMLIIPATGTYRGLAADRDWNQVRQMDLIGNFKTYLNQESILELRNGALVIEATRQAGNYEYGAGYWDQLIFRFVPAQLVGKGLKNSLMFQSSEDYTQNELAKLGYDIPGGSTLTGMADSFQQFGWFGCLFFAGMGLLFKTLYRATLQPNPIFAQLIYIQITTSAMRALTHQTIDFLPGLVYYSIFLGLLYLYAREPVKTEQRMAEVGGRKSERGKRRVQRSAAAPFSVTRPEDGSGKSDGG
jgi:oligosaccharide repeat unit polymerase